MYTTRLFSMRKAQQPFKPALKYCYIVGLGLDCKFIDLLIKRSINIFIKISLYLNFIVLEIISKQTDTLI